MIRTLLLIICLSTLTAKAAVNYNKAFDAVRSTKAVSALFNNAVDQGTTNELHTALESHIASSTFSNSQIQTKIQALFDIYFLLELTQNQDLDKHFLKWLADYKRLSYFLYSIDTKDKIDKALNILQQLYLHDTKNAPKFFKLMIAMSLVWDQPRLKLHHQMGKNILSYEEHITERYDYFKQIYTRGAKINYSRLSIQDLIFVVDTPLPLSELLWARKNVRSSLSKWGNLYPEIVYDKKRLERKQYQWLYGTYTMEQIKKVGGICVDQAYYTVIAARAFGIPAIFLHGRGRNAGEMHAWCGYMQSPGKWNMEVGRYEEMKFVTGWTKDPQSNLTITDHTLDFKCNKDLSGANSFKSKRLTAIAQFYKKNHKEKHFLTAVQTAISSQPLNIQPWDALGNYYQQKKLIKPLVALLKKKMTVFKKYPDFVLHIGQNAVKILRENGLDRDADRLEGTISRGIKKREDLTETHVKDNIAKLYKSGKAEEGRKAFETYLKKQEELYDQLENDLTEYLKYTKEHKQTKKAVSFMRRIIKGKREKNFMHFLAEAYRNDGDEKRAERVMK